MKTIHIASRASRSDRQNPAQQLEVVCQRHRARGHYYEYLPFKLILLTNIQANYWPIIGGAKYIVAHPTKLLGGPCPPPRTRCSAPMFCARFSQSLPKFHTSDGDIYRCPLLPGPVLKRHCPN